MWEAPVHVGEGETRGNCHTIVYGGGAGALTSTEAAVTANARLIAAAPDMFALLRKMEDWLRPEVVKEPDRTFFWQIVDLRRKVEGKPRLFDQDPNYPPTQGAVILDNGDYKS